MDFLEEVRLSRARYRLATTELPIRAIANRVRFQDPNNFSRAFRGRWESPKHFRSTQSQRRSAFIHAS